MSVTWGQFAERDPELAALGEGQLARTGLALVGTLRRDGWPRISPVEPFIVDGNLYLGMMWQSRKALGPATRPALRGTQHGGRPQGQ